MIPVRFYLIAAAIVVLVTGFLWYRHSLIAEGESIKAIAQQEAANEQAGKDAKVTQETVSGLNAEINQLRAHAAEPAPDVRLCSSPRPVRAPAVAAGTSSGPAAAGSVSGVSEGTGSGPNVGPSLQQFAEAADLVSARDRACLKWARGIAK